jgi:hypothetical protein
MSDSTPVTTDSYHYLQRVFEIQMKSNSDLTYFTLFDMPFNLLGLDRVKKTCFTDQKKSIKKFEKTKTEW